MHVQDLAMTLADVVRVEGDAGGILLTVAALIAIVGVAIGFLMVSSPRQPG
jgi:hypothetical protein